MPRDIKCFVIMPFSEISKEHTEAYWTNLFNTFLKPLIEEHPRVEACKSSARREDLLSEILNNLVTSQIVVADLTDYNPNVFWELGIRQSFKHGTITIAEESTRLPFDIGKKGTLFYHPKDMLKNEYFRKNFKIAIVDCINNPDRPDSIVLETLGGRGSLFQIIRSEEVSRRISSLKSELKYNQDTLADIFKAAKENIETRKAKKDKKKENELLSNREITCPTVRLRFSCIELLITNRYIDSSVEFYKKSEKYFDFINTLNDQLKIWETSQPDTEEYIVSQADQFNIVFNEFEVLLPK